jgi:hypothetical protein
MHQLAGYGSAFFFPNIFLRTTFIIVGAGCCRFRHGQNMFKAPEVFTEAADL